MGEREREITVLNRIWGDHVAVGWFRALGVLIEVHRVGGERGEADAEGGVGNVESMTRAGVDEARITKVGDF